jgi:hypothetical protein
MGAIAVHRVFLGPRMNMNKQKSMSARCLEFLFTVVRGVIIDFGENRDSLLS